MATATITEPTSAANGNIPFVGADPGDRGDGNTLREAITRINNRIKEIYGAQNSGGVVQTPFIDNDNIKDNAVDHDELAIRFTEEVSITTLTGTVSFNCASGSVFKLSGDLSGAYTISLTEYKKGQIITIYPIKGNQTLNLAGAGTSSNTFNKIGGVDYNDDGSTSNILQIECVDDSATAPIFFYSIATFAEDSSDI